MAAQFTFTNGPFDRALHLWMASAISSLPVPVSPLINTVASVGATTRTMSSTRRRAALLPTMRGKSMPRSSSQSSATFDVASSTSMDALWFTSGSSLIQVACADMLLLLSFAAIRTTLLNLKRREGGRDLGPSSLYQGCRLRLPDTEYKMLPTAPRQAASGECLHRTLGKPQSCLPLYGGGPHGRLEGG